MTPVREMAPRELVRGLMRGDARKFKQGYTSENAVIAAAELQDLPQEERTALLEYAEGFYAGITAGEVMESFPPGPTYEGYMRGLDEMNVCPG